MYTCTRSHTHAHARKGQGLEISLSELNADSNSEKRPEMKCNRTLQNNATIELRDPTHGRTKIIT